MYDEEEAHMSEPRTCIMCNHWIIYFEHDWSEYTPGDGFVSKCLKYHWSSDYDVSSKKYRASLLTANGCPDYEEVHDDR